MRAGTKFNLLVAVLQMVRNDGIRAAFALRENQGFNGMAPSNKVLPLYSYLLLTENGKIPNTHGGAAGDAVLAG